MLKEGILYGQDGDVVQLVVPHPLWESVLHLARDPPVAGHQASERTLAQTLQWFYWLGYSGLRCSDIVTPAQNVSWYNHKGRREVHYALCLS